MSVLLVSSTESFFSSKREIINCLYWIFWFKVCFPLFFRFGGKEEYMDFMNGFVEKEFVNMRKFLNEISVSKIHFVFFNILLLNSAIPKALWHV